MKFHEKEIELTNDIINSLEWTEKKVASGKTNVLYCNYFPIMINKVHAVNLSRHEEKIKDIDYAFFRPIRNGKHCQLMIDGAYEIDETILEVVTVRDPKTKRIEGWLETTDGQKIEVSRSLYTESEVKFAVLYKYWFDEDISKTILEVHEFNDKYKTEQNDRCDKNRKGSKSRLKLPKMN